MRATHAFNRGGLANQNLLDKAVDDQTQHVVLPVYDSSHFVLVYLNLDREKREWTAHDFDSFGPSNPTARRVAETMTKLANLRRADRTSKFAGWAPVKIQMVKVPNSLKQDNNFDCGIYTICAAEWFIQGATAADAQMC